MFSHEGKDHLILTKRKLMTRLEIKLMGLGAKKSIYTVSERIRTL